MMKRPERRRINPKPRRRTDPPQGVNLAEIADAAHYIGSKYHKDSPSFVGNAPHPRPDASICPRYLSSEQPTIQNWLREAIQRGNISGVDLRGRFPHKVWHRVGTLTFEAVGDSNGFYHGYPLEPDEVVHGLNDNP